MRILEQRVLELELPVTVAIGHQSAVFSFEQVHLEPWGGCLKIASWSVGRSIDGYWVLGALKKDDCKHKWVKHPMSQGRSSWVLRGVPNTKCTFFRKRKRPDWCWPLDHWAPARPSLPSSQAKEGRRIISFFQIKQVWTWGLCKLQCMRPIS